MVPRATTKETTQSDDFINNQDGIKKINVRSTYKKRNIVMREETNRKQSVKMAT